MTYPLIGNYGINACDNQSKKIQVQGFIVKEGAKNPSHWQMEKNLSRALAQAGVVGIKGIDTRALTRLIREHGVLRGVITTNLESLPKLAQELQEWEVAQDVVAQVSTKESYTLSPILKGEVPVADVLLTDAIEADALSSEAGTVSTAGESGAAAPYHVVVMDFGIKGNILQTMQEEGYDLTVVPYSTSAEEILALKPDGVFLSNGPGDPKVVTSGIEAIRELVKHLPVFGICLGHQLLTLALGGDTYKLKYGHRGGNQPVQDLRTEKVTITSQNHGYAVAEQSLENTPLEVTHLNLNDRTVEGVRHTQLPVFSVQYHPEAGPGPNDSLYLFKEFTALMAEGRAAHAT
jgi:carbamoyl-phosphate synthase small subunit